MNRIERVSDTGWIFSTDAELSSEECAALRSQLGHSLPRFDNSGSEIVVITGLGITEYIDHRPRPPLKAWPEPKSSDPFWEVIAFGGWAVGIVATVGWILAGG